MARARRWLRGLFVGGGVMLVALLCGELVLRVTGKALPEGAWGPRYMYVADAELGMRPRPGFHGRHRTEEFDVAIEIDQDGLRGPELAQAAEEDLVILVVSDSFGFGFGVEAGETLAARLEERLREHLAPRRVQVINAGVPSYGQRQMALQVRRVGAKVRPDVVLATFLYANDLDDNLDEKGFTERGGLVVRPASARWIDEHALLDFSLEHSDLMLVLTRWWLGVSVAAEGAPVRSKDPKTLQLRAPNLPYFRRDGAEPKAEAWAALGRELVNLREACQALGARCALIDIAFPFQFDDAYWQETCALHSVDAAAYDRARVSTVVAGLCAELGIEHLDLAQAWKGRADAARLFFPLNLHWTAAGHAAVAESAEEFLRQRGWL